MVSVTVKRRGGTLSVKVRLKVVVAGWAAGTEVAVKAAAARMALQAAGARERVVAAMATAAEGRAVAMNQ